MKKDKLNNLLTFDDFSGELPLNKQKKTKRTDVGLDILNESKGLVYTILTKDVSDRYQDTKYRSLRNMGFHFLCKTRERYEYIKNLYPLGGIYNGSEIIDTHVTKESEGWGTDKDQYR